jgi:TPR repeat protein
MRSHADAKHARQCATLEAIGLRQDAEAQGCVQAMWHLGQASWAKGDKDGAFLWLKRAADSGHSLAPHDVALLYRNGHGVAQSPKDAWKYWALGASRGDPQAFLELACCYLFGYGTKRDPEKFKSFATKAAEAGNVEAPYYISLEYKEGGTLPRNDAEAARWLRMGVERGDPRAQGLLGEHLVRGEGGFPQDVVEGKRLLLQSADGGYVAAQLTLASCFEHGLFGDAPDVDAALHWYRRAAEEGHDAQAQRMLGELLDASDPKQSAMWYARAAEQGLAHAQRALAGAHSRGRGVVPDAAAAESLLLAAQSEPMCCEASAADVSAASLWLGACYEKGEAGVGRDATKARTWYEAAAKGGSKEAEAALARM